MFNVHLKRMFILFFLFVCLDVMSWKYQLSPTVLSYKFSASVALLILCLEDLSVHVSGVLMSLIYIVFLWTLTEPLCLLIFVLWMWVLPLHIFFSFWLSMIVSVSIILGATDDISHSIFYGWVVFHCMYVPHILYAFICLDRDLGYFMSWLVWLVLLWT